MLIDLCTACGTAEMLAPIEGETLGVIAAICPSCYERWLKGTLTFAGLTKAKNEKAKNHAIR